jgi:hypothetical protein
MGDFEKKTADVGIEPVGKEIAKGTVTDMVCLWFSHFDIVLIDTPSSMSREKVFPARSSRGMFMA